MRQRVDTPRANKCKATADTTAEIMEGGKLRLFFLGEDGSSAARSCVRQTRIHHADISLYTHD